MKVESQAHKILSLKRNSCIEKRIFFFLKKDKIQVSASYKTHIQFNDTQKLRAESWKRINSTDNKIKLVLQLLAR